MLYPGNVLHDTDENGKKTDEWVCHGHGHGFYQKYDIVMHLQKRRCREVPN